MLSEVALEPKVPESAKEPEPTVVPPKEKPEKKGTSSVCAHSFF